VALWQPLRAGQQGEWFRRQVVLLGSCIVDFYCPATKVVVEVDGAYHTEPARKRADARRDRRRVKAGYRAVRVSAELVLADGEAALRLGRLTHVSQLSLRSNVRELRALERGFGAT
jgi:very-short-patch-repair endonuclease